jgi:hypothetical protein
MRAGRGSAPPTKSDFWDVELLLQPSGARQLLEGLGGFVELGDATNLERDLFTRRRDHVVSDLDTRFEIAWAPCNEVRAPNCALPARL